VESGNQYSMQAFNAIAKSVDRLHGHGYELYLKTHSYSWTNRRNVTVGAEPFFFVFGNGILPSPTYALIFGIQLSWQQDQWRIVAEIERETYGDTDSLETLWEQKYSATNFEDFVVILSKATDDLIRETSSEWFYSQIAEPK